MSVERLNKLERIVIKMEGSISNLTDKMSDVASALSTMSDAMSRLAVYDTKMERMEKDITNIASAVRTVNERITSLHSEHSNHCEVKIDEVRNSGVKRLVYGLSVGLGALTFAFGYLYLDINAHEDADRKNHELLGEIRTQLAVIEEKLKKANGHRYYIAKGIKEELQR